ncbi:ring-hydroxylating oxygenase subunit alpha [Chelatococcus reniformis]|uniref:Rieske domain-containing protein n=1 Tax=Chelatococcus reniformis TaxID=1494448 RepID=A0A916XIR7_9HYPH|nr:ring-hydroxylating oxygenase subunit alpha [Chelatococcus reniformis]GGC74557.1 hypothetical protein GCM10010994_36290 [Chelatococcus reniformis]
MASEVAPRELPPAQPDFSAAAFYAEALLPPGRARVLPPAAFRSLAFARQEDIAVWACDWICVGAHAEIPEVGDLLPFTVGDHGLHVQRTADGLTARFNKAQHGGCRVVPLQCQQGSKTRCSFTSCGHSRDRGPIAAGELGDGTPQMHQYLGLRPERLLTAQARSWGPLIFVNLDAAPPDFAEAVTGAGTAFGFFDNSRGDRLATTWREYRANWKLLALGLTGLVDTPAASTSSWLAGRADSHGLDVAWLFPNLVLLADAEQTCALVLQPTALGQTLARITVFGRGEARPGDGERWLGLIDALARAAESAHVAALKWGTASRPDTIDAPLPLQASASGHWMQRALSARMTAARIDPTPIYQPSRAR